MWKGNRLGKITILLEVIIMNQISESAYFKDTIMWDKEARLQGGIEICDDETGQPMYVIGG